MRDRLRFLAWGAYGVAFLLILVPLLDAVVGVWPLRVGDISWRFGATGLLSRSLMSPLFGLLIGLVTAAQLGHRRFARVLAIIGFLGGGLALAAIGLFTLDALQVRASVRAEAMRAVDVASGVALLKYFLGAIVAFLLGIGGWKASRKSEHPAAGKSREDTAERRKKLLIEQNAE